MPMSRAPGFVDTVNVYFDRAAALTEYLGRYLDAAMDNPDSPPPIVTLKDLKTVIQSALKKRDKAEA